MDKLTDISQKRAEIDEIDENILELINQRLLKAKDIGTQKAKDGKRVFDSARESAVIKRLQELNKGPLSSRALRRISLPKYSLPPVKFKAPSGSHTSVRKPPIPIIRPTGRDKTSIMFVTSHVPGALYQVLQPIAEAGINMVKLESRPSRHENWSYMFFVDVEGHMADAKVKGTVEKMKSRCLYLKWLGSYPRAHEGTGGIDN